MLPKQKPTESTLLYNVTALFDTVRELIRKVNSLSVSSSDTTEDSSVSSDRLPIFTIWKRGAVPPPYKTEGKFLGDSGAWTDPFEASYPTDIDLPAFQPVTLAAGKVIRATGSISASAITVSAASAGSKIRLRFSGTISGLSLAEGYIYKSNEGTLSNSAPDTGIIQCLGEMYQGTFFINIEQPTYIGD